MNNILTNWKYCIAVLFLGLTLALVGCQSSIPDDIDTSLDRDLLIEACQAELKSHGFTINTIDYRMGLVSTLPLTGKQWFEFWRNDIIDPASIIESSLHTIRRSVQCSLTNSPSQPVVCKVSVEKLCLSSLPQERVQSNSSPFMASRQIYYHSNIDSFIWESINSSDSILEKKLIEGILKRYKQKENPI